MTDHKQQAEMMLKLAQELLEETDMLVDHPIRQDFLTRAGIHATLALTEAMGIPQKVVLGINDDPPPDLGGLYRGES